MSEDKRTDGIGRWGRPSRHRPPGRTATADTAQGHRQRAHLPGPPGDVHTARNATDTWPAQPSAVIPEADDLDSTSGAPQKATGDP
jgi:hypothetical protein